MISSKWWMSDSVMHSERMEEEILLPPAKRRIACTNDGSKLSFSASSSGRYLSWSIIHLSPEHGKVQVRRNTSTEEWYIYIFFKTGFKKINCLISDSSWESICARARDEDRNHSRLRTHVLALGLNARRRGRSSLLRGRICAVATPPPHLIGSLGGHKWLLATVPSADETARKNACFLHKTSALRMVWKNTSIPYVVPLISVRKLFGIGLSHFLCKSP